MTTESKTRLMLFVTRRSKLRWFGACTFNAGPTYLGQNKATFALESIESLFHLLLLNLRFARAAVDPVVTPPGHRERDEGSRSRHGLFGFHTGYDKSRERNCTLNWCRGDVSGKTGDIE